MVPLLGLPPVAHPARGREEDDVLEVAVLVERPLAARVAVHGRAVRALVLVGALRRGWKLEDDVDSAARRLGGCCLLMLVPPFALPQRGRIACATVGEPRLAASLCARSLDAEPNSSRRSEDSRLQPSLRVYARGRCPGFRRGRRTRGPGRPEPLSAAHWSR